MEIITSTKIKLRALVKDELSKLDTDSRKAEEEAVYKKLNNISFSKNVLVFMPMKDEIDIIPFILKLLKNNHKVFIPMTFGECNMDFYEIREEDFHNEHGFKLGQYKILESRHNNKYIYTKGDCMIVPGVAFDKNGNRMGRGKGYYDRFLGEYQLNTIAVAYNCQLFDNIPTDKYDISMNYIITEAFVYKKD